MPAIQKKIRLAGSLGKSEERALFDSGSTYSCIQPRLAKRLGITEPLLSPKRFGTAEKGRTVTARERISLDFRLDGYTFSDEFMVVSGLTERVIIGAKTLQAWRMKLDFPRRGSFGGERRGDHRSKSHEIPLYAVFRHSVKRNGISRSPGFRSPSGILRSGTVQRDFA